MQMRITKNTGKPHIIKYIRDNGTETWMYSDDFFVRHDLSHYAIESVMEYRTAFNGMLNEGMDIKDFEDREKRTGITVTDEACHAENMSNLFLTEIMQGEFEDFNAVQKESFIAMNTQCRPVTLSEEKIAAIRNYLTRLFDQWNEMPVGETMELIFNV
ncbi:MAG: hypothetical protein JWQ30_1237 [Sediminibacterium sp.]|nr:hypothetical protein [Sediminibacterium sp.]